MLVRDYEEPANKLNLTPAGAGARILEIINKLFTVIVRAGGIFSLPGNLLAINI